MKVARHIIEARREAIAKLLSKVGYVPVLEICKQFNVSEATARRDLTELENQRRITRTHGGALSDFNRNFPPLDDRKIEDAEAKRRIGNLAASRVKAGMTVYLDSGSTIFFAAEAIAAAGVPDLQIVTTCLPTAQLISCLPGVEVYIPGGLFLTRHAMVAGDRTLEEVARWNFDVALLGAEGIDENGLWNSQRDIVLICMNKIKLGRGGPCAVTRDVTSLFLVTDADAAAVQKAKVKLLPERVLTAL
jgi:DeoR/GlpR family transcriptional regulator of sugar metabolism